MEEGLAITALAGHEFRPAYLDWFAQNPDPAPSAPIALLEKVAAHRDELLRDLLALPIESGNGPRALDLLRSKLGLRPVATSGSSASGKKSCCGG